MFDLDTILDHHHVTDADRPAIRGLILRGRRPAREMRAKIRGQYAACYDEILTAVSAPAVAILGGRNA